MRKKQIINRKYIYIFISFIIFSTGILLFNDFGLIQLFQLQNKKNQLTHQLEVLLNQQTTLREDINKLQTDEEYIKKIAREEFYMAAPGEIIYRVKRDKIFE